MIQLSVGQEQSYLILCPHCFDIVARVTGTSPYYWHRYVPCETHDEASYPYGCRVAGSLIEAEPTLIDLLPDDLLLREFNLTLASTRNPNGDPQ
jgi:hypothetical protein